MRQKRRPAGVGIERHLRLGQASVDLTVRRHGTDVSLQMLRNEGQIGVKVIYS